VWHVSRSLKNPRETPITQVTSTNPRVKGEPMPSLHRAPAWRRWITTMIIALTLTATLSAVAAPARAADDSDFVAG
jgi:hypothetical protein